jgi:hypothetical protein
MAFATSPFKFTPLSFLAFFSFNVNYALTSPWITTTVYNNFMASTITCMDKEGGTWRALILTRSKPNFTWVASFAT